MSHTNPNGQGRGIRTALTGDSGRVDVNNSGAITLSGNNMRGIDIHMDNGDVMVENTGAILATGNALSGVVAWGKTATIISHADVTLTGAGVTTQSTGALLANGLAGDATITASGHIKYNDGNAIEARSQGDGAQASVSFQNGSASSDSGIAILVGNGGADRAGTGEIIIGANASVLAPSTIALKATQESANNVEIAQGARINGGVALQFETVGGTFGANQRNTLLNNGIMESTQDKVVQTNAMAGSATELTNAATGLMVGVIELAEGTNTLNNAGQWNLRMFADSDLDGTRDTLSVALSDFGAGGNNRITNSGTIALLGKGDATAQTLDTTGMYVPFGYSVNTMSLNSPAQGQLMGVKTFENSGVIDLTANVENGVSVVGDVLVISGGHTAGTDGGGVFIANGGTLKLNTVLNEGGANSQSDILVLDSTRLGSAATLINVTNAGGNGALTVGNGIALVEVLNKSQSADGVFMLGQRVAAGAYDYFLYHNGVGTDGADGNWYLRSIETPPPPSPFPPAAVEIVTRPEVVVASAVQSLATEYGYAMLGTLHDRVGESHASTKPVTEERFVRCKDASQNFRCVVRVPVSKDETRWASSGWARLMGDRGINKSDSFSKRGPNYDYTFGGIQAGLDIYANEQADGTLDKAGIYVGYGQISSDVSGPFGLNGVKVIGKAGSVDMDAYTVGGYWTHKAASGWYTDAVIQGTWYSANAHSILNQNVKPDGFGILASLEGGYAFKLNDGWTIEPQAQIVYQNVSFGKTRDAYGQFSFGDGDSLRGRLGVRVAKSWNMADAGQEARLVTAWLRANIWHEFMGKSTTSVGSFNGGNVLSFNSKLGGTWAEIGAGVSAQISDKVSLFATGAYNRSLDNRGREGWDGRLGVTVKW